ncbi:hypothetical protein [Piscibacillus salipiscarius]|uniref:hypothetical protein n=1 Tax=Piscibacillus salipiscarius TaxID=299480 RepID=UPI0006D072F5|nr:hypothetical protein [Piscibacillus salipiscarius]
MILTSPDNAFKEEYHRAFELLVYFLTNASSIKRNGTERKNINMIAYEKTKSFLKDIARDTGTINKPVFDKCLNTITSTLNLQTECIELVEEYESFMKKKT